MPTGLVSVIPQACRGVTPNSSAKAFIIAGGAAAPPTTIRGRADSVETVRPQVLKQSHPDGGYAGAEGDLFLLEQLVQAGAVEPWPR